LDYCYIWPGFTPYSVLGPRLASPDKWCCWFFFNLDFLLLLLPGPGEARHEETVLVELEAEGSFLTLLREVLPVDLFPL